MVNTQIQRAISDAITSQILPQIQTTLNAGSGHLTQNRWNVPSERPEINTKETYGENVKKNSRCEQRSDHLNDGQSHSRAYDNYDTINFPKKTKFLNTKIFGNIKN